MTKTFKNRLMYFILGFLIAILSFMIRGNSVEKYEVLLDLAKECDAYCKTDKNVQFNHFYLFGSDKMNIECNCAEVKP